MTPVSNQLFADQERAIGTAAQQALLEPIYFGGLGRLGTAMLWSMVRAGAKRIAGNDPQVVTNDNRGFLAYPERFEGKPKAEALAETLRETPDLDLRLRVDRNESPETARRTEQAAFIVSAANTLAAREALARVAINARKPLLDVSVSDTRRKTQGFVKIWLPENESWSACPMCYYGPEILFARGEGLISTVIGLTAFGRRPRARPIGYRPPGRDGTKPQSAHHRSSHSRDRQVCSRAAAGLSAVLEDRAQSVRRPASR